MEFFLGNRRDAFLIKLSQTQRFALTSGVLFCGVALWYCCVYVPGASHLAAYKIQLHTQKQQFSVLEQSKQQTLQLDSLIATLDKDLALYSKQDGKRFSFDQALLQMINCAGKTGLAMNTCMVNDPVDKQWYTKNNVQVQLQGKFANVLQFFQEIEKSQLLVWAKDMQLTRNSNELFDIKCTLSFMSIK